ncbi:pyruvate kinase [Tuwongella immobilis]|uniref:Pyruvate kinase n=1 Tax=Tuwongella immobilis TaxID=692036 RepID=A0A6C2YVT2_9BACT|nr:pyruvate kinase [Tuwongella immobilis]VIP05477.1 pyruvate kinase : Pyruvate kinase OS=Desulfotomaculum reducens (strain MI-1) GN=Dred_0381 PE=3 SV=1: PK: PK_C [Tuwongella immobilis]VTS08310.1 pyruvate kinase : Pyruvate kinase OS=Desulfotomaculum reducens (strain MI-1) GN=Dred_0381 PE=3 SV=1: PK: PK_C [Tuwongella immobilis]
MRRRTRIVATLGPAADPPEILAALIEAGVDIARINFSHGSAEEHLDRIERFRQAARAAGRNVAVLADLPGPKLRCKMPQPLTLTPGHDVTFSMLAKAEYPDDIALTEPELLRDVQPGHRILLDDGRLQLEAIRFEGYRLVARVKVGGVLLPNKGINLPDSPLSIEALTPRDRVALEIAARAQVDWVALSFVRDPESAQALRAEMAQFGLVCPILAKIERPEAVTTAPAIIAAFDGIMVARGDLGVEIPLERVPSVQKRLIGLARSMGKPVITATDMLDSMRMNPRPTRAEASDVANAIYDGTDAVMLSGETAVGNYPVEAVTCMHRIALETEAHLHRLGSQTALLDTPIPNQSIDDSITDMTCSLAQQLSADAIVMPTLSSRTARLLARHRPWTKLIAPTPHAHVMRQMAIIWGVIPVQMPTLEPGKGRMDAAVLSAVEAGVLEPGQLVVVLAGHPLEGGDRLPTIRVLRVGPDGRSASP